MNVSLGVASYDLSGTGTRAVAALRYEHALGGPVHLEVGSALFHYRPQALTGVTLVLPEAGLRLRFQVRGLGLSVVAGAGYSLVAAGSGDNDPTLFGVVGAQFDVGSGWSSQPELRARAVDPWVGTIASFDLGIRKSLGR